MPAILSCSLIFNTLSYSLCKLLVSWISPIPIPVEHHTVIRRFSITGLSNFENWIYCLNIVKIIYRFTILLNMVWITSYVITSAFHWRIIFVFMGWQWSQLYIFVIKPWPFIIIIKSWPFVQPWYGVEEHHHMICKTYQILFINIFEFLRISTILNRCIPVIIKIFIFRPFI
jgi:hypothetical protein